MAELTIDALGPFQRTPLGNKYLIVVVDSFSQYIIAWPTKDLTGASLARQFYQKIICVHGAPKRLLTDNGSNFISEVLRSLCDLFGIKNIYSCAYTPQAQG